jgi:hypothetical protein
MKNVLVVLLGILLGSSTFFSCQIEKRVHRPGYHVQYKKSKPAKTAKIDHKKSESLKDSEVHTFLEEQKNQESLKDPLLVAKKDKDNEVVEFQSKVEAIELFKPDVIEDNSQECETIVYTNGVLAKVKIEEITPTVIRYLRCDLKDGPLITVNRYDVYKIIYSNGAEDIITEYDNPKSGKNSLNAGATFDGIGLVSFISSLVGLLIAGIIFGPVAIIFGIISIARTSSEKKEYKGKAFGVIGLLIGAIGTIIIVLYLSSL